MLVSNRGILDELRVENIIIQPFHQALLQPISYDLTLSADFKAQLIIEPDEVDPPCLDPQVDNSDYFADIHVPRGSAFSLNPGAFVLGSTHETIALGANIAATLEGKSSLGRLGLVVHATAGLIDPGFDGQITLEFSNVGTMPILLYPGMKIAQVCFYHLPEPTTLIYGSRSAGSHYQNQAGPTTSRSFENFQIFDVYGDNNG